jgi:hypothetical protein
LKCNFPFFGWIFLRKDAESSFGVLKMPVLSIVRGLPASGKSTFAKRLGCLHLEADMYFMVNGHYLYDPMQVETAHRWCQLMAATALALGFDVVVSNTFTRAWELEPYFQMAKESGAGLDIYRTSGEFTGIHNVPEEVVNAMRLRFEDIKGEILV